jgi:hypothetical protein
MLIYVFVFYLLMKSDFIKLNKHLVPLESIELHSSMTAVVLRSFVMCVLIK